MKKFYIDFKKMQKDKEFRRRIKQAKIQEDKIYFDMIQNTSPVIYSKIKKHNK